MRVSEIVGSGLCVASEDGRTVYEQIQSAFKRGYSVDLSFYNVDNLTSAFLNAAIGRLYGEFSQIEIRDKLKVSDMTPEDKLLLKRVVETAKEYFQDPAGHDNIVKSELGSDGDDGEGGGNVSQS